MYRGSCFERGTVRKTFFQSLLDHACCHRIAWVAVLLSLLLVMGGPVTAQDTPKKKPDPEKPTKQKPPPREEPVPDSLRVLYEQAQSSLQDSLSTDASDSVPLAAITLADTLQRPDSTGRIVMGELDFAWHDYTGFGDKAARLPGQYSRDFHLYAQPQYLIVPGGSGRDLAVSFRGRPYGDPLTDATNFATISPEEISAIYHTPAWLGPGQASSGPVMALQPHDRYPEKPLTRIIYRQSLYGYGRADWRVAHRPNELLAYHIGVNIGEYEGRYPNTYANTSHLRAGLLESIRGVGRLNLYWMQYRNKYGEPRTTDERNIHRNDVDVVFSGGVPGEGSYRELGLWYVRNTRKYGAFSEDGNRLGGRVVWKEYRLKDHEIVLRADLERTAARFVRRPTEIDPQGRRWVAGLGGGDEFQRGWLTVRLHLRGEYSLRAGIPDTTEAATDLRVGGSLYGDFGPEVGPGALGLVSRSWRWPSLDESFGYWSVDDPERWMDRAPLPQGTLYYRGNPALEPVMSTFAGGGVRYHFDRRGTVRLTAGVRNWSDPIEIVYAGSDTYTRRNLGSVTALELQAYGDVPVWGPVSVAGAWTYSDGVEQGDPVPETWGWGSLRVDQQFYNGQLQVRLAANGTYYDETTYQNQLNESAFFVDGVLRIRVLAFEVNYGRTNLLEQKYEHFPGYPAMHRGEFWGVRWHLWE